MRPNIWSLNKIIVKDRFLIQVIDDLLYELKGDQLFSKIDLCSSYYLIRMKEVNILKTDFCTHEGHFDFLVNPNFGLCNAPSTFQSLTNKIFQPFIHHCVLVFIYDMLICSKIWHAHVTYMD